MCVIAFYISVFFFLLLSLSTFLSGSQNHEVRRCKEKEEEGIFEHVDAALPPLYSNHRFFLRLFLRHFRSSRGGTEAIANGEEEKETLLNKNFPSVSDV